MALHYRLWKFLNPEREGDRVCLLLARGSEYPNLLLDQTGVLVRIDDQRHARRQCQYREDGRPDNQEHCGSFLLVLCPIVIECGKI